MQTTRTRYRNLLLVMSTVLVIVTAIAGCSDDEEDRPNIVLVSIDTLRTDRLGAYGYDRGLTPHLDELAENGVVFERAVTTAGTTWPAHASMLTGLYPRYHGVRRNGLELDEDIPVITELLAEAGYSTGSFVSYKGMHFRGKLDRGFETASDREFTDDGEDPIRDGDGVTAMTVDWLKQQADSKSPSFLWLHLFEPHSPYELTDYSREWIQENDYDGFLADGASVDELQKRRREIVSSPEHVAAMNALYDGEVQLADELVGRVLDRLETDGQLENSIVIVVSDHGEGLGEHGNMGHGPTLREDVLHVPLIIRDFRSNQGGRRIAETVSMIDLAPTIAKAALDIDLPGVQGRSLAARLRGDNEQEPDDREVFAEIRLWPDLEEAPDWYDDKSTAIYADGLKFKMQRGETTVFDPRVQPSAEKRLDSPEVNEAFLAYLDSVRSEFLDGEIKTGEVELTDDEIETLKSLGYIQ